MDPVGLRSWIGRARSLAGKVRGRRLIIFGDARDRYVHEAPSPQVTVDLFRGEWTSRLPAKLGVSGDGAAELFDDERVAWGLERLGGVDGLDVLELGPLEGAHTAMLHDAGARRILSVEGNSRAFLRCLAVKELLGLERAHVVCGEFLKHLRLQSDEYDLCLAFGVLYHQRDPVDLLALTARRAKRLLLWTHYHDPARLEGNARLRRRSGDAIPATTAGFSHALHEHRYGYSQRVASFCGGMHRSANWLSREDLLGALAHVGWEDVEIAYDQPDHSNGPALALVAHRRD